MSATARLCVAALAALPNDVAQPAYDRAETSIGVVHFGPGAFHRAHQADVFDRLLATDPRCAICAVSLKNPGVRDALAPQDGLYTLVELDNVVRYRVIGALKLVLVAPEAPDEVLARLADPALRLITLTVTEKGYCLNEAGALDLQHPDILHDIAHPASPISVIGWLAAGLRARRAAGAWPVPVLSCDNLSGNGDKLGAAVADLAAAQGKADLAAWIAAEVPFPNTMVDSITPATDEALRERVRGHLGLEDAWPIQRERFTQWVVEDRLGPRVPDLASAGVILAKDVRPFERAKLRLLNGAHSTLAYVGLAMGCETVAEAMGEQRLAAFVEAMMRQDIAPTLVPDPALDVAAYIDAVLARFRNPSIRHQLAQIAWDGSQKLPVRILATLADRLDAGAGPGRLAVPIAAWMLFVRRRAASGDPITDPLSDALNKFGVATGGFDEIVDWFFGLEQVFPPAIAASDVVRAEVVAAYPALAAGDFAGALDR